MCRYLAMGVLNTVPRTSHWPWDTHIPPLGSISFIFIQFSAKILPNKRLSPQDQGLDFSLPPPTKLGQGYVFTGVCDSVHGGGVPHQVHPPGPGARYTPWDQVHPPGPGTPPGTRYTPRTRYTPPDQLHPPRNRCPPDQVHPPGPGTPPQTRYTPQEQVPPGPGTPPWDQVHPLDQVPPWDQVHPPGTRYTPLDQVHPPGPGRYGLRTGGTHPTGMHSCCLNPSKLPIYNDTRGGSRASSRRGRQPPGGGADPTYFLKFFLKNPVKWEKIWSVGWGAPFQSVNAEVNQWRIYIVKFWTRAPPPPGVQILSISCSFW